MSLDSLKLSVFPRRADNSEGDVFALIGDLVVIDENKNKITYKAQGICSEKIDSGDFAIGSASFNYTFSIVADDIDFKMLSTVNGVSVPIVINEGYYTFAKMNGVVIAWDTKNFNVSDSSAKVIFTPVTPISLMTGIEIIFNPNSEDGLPPFL